MIFVAVGTQLPFDRLIEAVDSWEGCGEVEVVAQVGTGGGYKGKSIKSFESLPASEFSRLCKEAEVIVAHAGMGVILSARENGKPLIIMPRKAELKEHRNDHQLATARHFGEIEGIYVVQNAYELHQLLDDRDKLSGAIDAQGAGKSLLNRIAEFIDGDE